MSVPPFSVRVLLIQVRERPDVEEQEQRCFIERLGIRPDQLDAVNIDREPIPSPSRVGAANAVMIGGSGVYSVTQEHTFTTALRDVVLRLCDTGKPTFGVCWGHQFIAQTLGGNVVTDVDSAEAGTHEVTLTSQGRADPLFTDRPDRFAAHMGHHDCVATMPPGAILLARSTRCPHQAFRIAGKPIYGTQFHCELNSQRLVKRLDIYRHLYMPDDKAFEAFRDSPTPTPEADQILRRFLTHVVVGS
ncbi:MAG: type 1 glutamine amidotransferase [Phycisphaerae bacterium]